MFRRRAALAAMMTAIAALLAPAVARAQQPAPVPLYPGAVPRSFDERALPSPAAPVQAPPPATAAAGMSPPAQRVFCEQPVAVRLADRNALPQRYREFVGMWSDAAWTPQLCAALVVENVTADGTATILYVFGPTRPDAGAAGGVLNGTGVIRDGELRFENSDGSQFTFRPLYADLQGHLTTPQGRNYDATFKRAF